MDYSEVFSRAWQIVWKHKALWIFGILAGCASGSGGSGGGGGGSQNIDSGNRGWMAPEPWKRAFENIPQEAWSPIIIGIICLILILVLIALFLGTIGKIGLVRGTALADQDLEARLPFGMLFRASLPYFWRVFLLNLLVGLVVFVVIAAGIALAFFGAVVTLGIGIICLLPLICLLIPIMIMVGVVLDQATIAIVTEDRGILDGLQRGWEVVRSRPGPYVVVWLALELGVRFIGSLILGLPMLLFLAPLFFSLLSQSEKILGVGAIISISLVICYLPFLIVLSGLLNAYVQSGWTLTFLRLSRTSDVSPEPLPEPAV